MNMDVNLLFANRVFGVLLYFIKQSKKSRKNILPREAIITTFSSRYVQHVKTKSISLIPLAKDGGYTIAIEGKRGLKIEFSKHRS
jgi:hypothetical protein